MDAKEFPDIIAAHECGHVVALAAAGLADEFKMVTIVPNDRSLGITDCTWISRDRLVANLGEHSRLLTGDAGQHPEVMKNFKAFIQTVPAVCLPYLCYYYGGGSCDRLFGRESVDRNMIDANEIRTNIIPATLIPNPTEEDLQQIQRNVDRFLFKVLDEEEKLFGLIYTALVQRKTIDRDSLGQDILDEMQACSKYFSEDYKELLKWFEEWHAKQLQNLEFMLV